MYRVLATTVWSIAFLAPAAASPYTRPQVAITAHSRVHDGGAVPGDSLVHYYGNPANNLFAIYSLDMYPNPESYCGVKLWGTFKEDIPKAHLSVNITTHFDDGRTGGMRIEDDFGDWADVMQNDTLQSSPRKGKAVISYTTLLVGGWIPKANYTAKVLVKSAQDVVLYLWTEFEMKTKT